MADLKHNGKKIEHAASAVFQQILQTDSVYRVVEVALQRRQGRHALNVNAGQSQHIDRIIHELSNEPLMPS